MYIYLYIASNEVSPKFYCLSWTRISQWVIALKCIGSFHFPNYLHMTDSYTGSESSVSMSILFFSVSNNILLGLRCVCPFTILKIVLQDLWFCETKMSPKRKSIIFNACLRKKYLYVFNAISDSDIQCNTCSFTFSISMEVIWISNNII